MENRIDRKTDENLYQPKIHSERIRALYQLKQETGKPLTVLLDQAVRDFAASYGPKARLAKNHFFETQIRKHGKKFANTEDFWMSWNIKGAWRNWKK
jgi:hypothetical protein